MPRHARVLSPTNLYHVVIKGADRRLLFEEKQDYIKYLDILEYYKSECNFELFAYCLMSNHTHLLIRHPDTISLSTIFRRINTTYACWFNAKYDRTGYVQDGRFFSQPIESQDHLFTGVHYIHFNPAKAGLEQFPGEKYPWSSFYDYLHEEKSLTDIAYVLQSMGGRDNFIDYHSSYDKAKSDFKCIDIEDFRRRLPDDVAKDIIYQTSNCKSITEFEALTINERNRQIITLHEKGISIRQLNRLTGTPRGVIERVLSQQTIK